MPTHRKYPRLPHKPASPHTRLEVDEEAGAIRIIINGQEQARINENGLHVRGNVNYGGTVMDIGRAAYDTLPEAGAGQHAD